MGLAARVLFFLSLALFPIGLIAIVQTREISNQNRLNGELSLLAVTEQASTAERYVLQEAFGAADALASIVPLYWDDAESCSEFFKAYRENTDVYEVVGYIPVSGVMACSSAEEIFDVSGTPAFPERLADPRKRAEPMRSGLVSRKLVTIVTSPVFYQDELQGFIAISIPEKTIEAIEEPETSLKPIAMVTFNDLGQILTTDGDMELARQELPSNVALSLFAGDRGQVFSALNQDEVERIYATQPIVQNGAYALSVWPSDTPTLTPDIFGQISTFLPVIMWIASLIVAFWALNRLALRHIRKLRRQMRRFALNRNLPRQQLDASVPTELREMEAAFIGMGESILRDEAQLENSLRDKNILLKEVHHRVKNNLQLISSIMNMQIRQVETEEAIRVLKRLQERILGLATVHKNLYQTENMVTADSKQLLSETVGRLLSVGVPADKQIAITQEIESFNLEADDAAPLALLVSEMVTNAVKHVGSDDPDCGGEICVRLAKIGPETARFQVSNTKGDEEKEEGTGLGLRLIHAFARQLNGQVSVRDEGVLHIVEIEFHVPQSAKAVHDF